MCIIIASKFCGFKNNHYLCTRNSEMIDDRGVEQLVARQAHNLEVACSSPASATTTSEKQITKAFRTFFVYTPVQGSDSKAQIYIG